MRPTRPSTLGLVALVALAFGWTLARIYDAAGQGRPDGTWLTAGLLAFLAGLLVVAARIVRGWVTERRYDRRMGPLVVSRLLALAKAASVCGAAVVGGYTGLALAHVLAQSDSGRLVRPLATVVAGALLVAAGLLLERACLVPQPPPDRRLG